MEGEERRRVTRNRGEGKRLSIYNSIPVKRTVCQGKDIQEEGGRINSLRLEGKKSLFKRCILIALIPALAYGNRPLK
jgi:hypothetical protein